jgi:hypothetical protein
MKIPSNWELTSYDVIKDKSKKGSKCKIVETDNEALLFKIFKNVKGKVYYYVSESYSVGMNDSGVRLKFYIVCY